MPKTTMRRAIAAILCLGMALATCACGDKDEGPNYADDEAMSVIGSGLTKRFKIVEQESDSNSEALSLLKEGIQAEIDSDTPLKDRSFQNTKLQGEILNYINVLNEQMDVTKDYRYESAEYTREWEKVYKKRTQILKTFVDDYGLKLTGKDQDTLEQLIADGASAAKEDKAKETINTLVSSIKFEKKATNYGSFEYVGIAENASDFTFENVSIVLGLYNSDGVKKESYTQITHWDPGEKVEVKTTDDYDAKEVKPTVQYFDIVD